MRTKGDCYVLIQINCAQLGQLFANSSAVTGQSQMVLIHTFSGYKQNESMHQIKLVQYIATQDSSVTLGITLNTDPSIKSI